MIHSTHPPSQCKNSFLRYKHEEETLFKGVLDKINLVGHDGHALFFVDKDLAEMAKTGSTSIMTDTAL